MSNTPISKIFNLGWKSLLVVAVFFITFTSTNVLITSYKDILNSERFQNLLYGGKYLVVGESKIKILIAETEQERIQGLSGKDYLEDDQGMLFIFPEEGNHGIWMKDMNFHLDIIWLDSTLQVVDFVENVSPRSFPEVFQPKNPAKYVLEVNSSYIKNNGIKIGDQATLLD